MNIPPVSAQPAVAQFFSSLNLNGEAVNPRDHVEPGTGRAVFLGFFVAIIGVLFGGLVTYGILWIALIFAPLVDYLNRKKAMALLRGSAVEVSDQQLPEVYQCAQIFAERLGMRSAPAVYLVEGNVINAAASRVAGRQVIVLMDDVVDACLRSGDPRTLAFILAHEMSHHALGHTGLIRAWLSRAFKKLSRLDEFSCDAVASELVGDPQVSANAITILISGPQILPYLNLNALLQQAGEVEADKHSKKAERRLSHPLLLRRLARFIQ